MRDFLLFLHIASAILIIGGLAFLSMIVPGLLRGGAENLPALRRLDQLGKVFGPSSIIVFLLGLWLAIRGDFDMGAVWLSASMLIFIVTAVLGGAVGGRLLGKAIGQLESGQSPDSEVSRLSMVGGINIVLLLAIVWLMVDKPGL
jgi:uncharacterized membrane protein